MPRFQRCDVTSGPSVLGRRGRRAVQTRAEPDNDEVHDRHRDHEQQDLYHEPAGSRTWGEPPDHQPIVGGRPRFHATERPTEQHGYEYTQQGRTGPGFWLGPRAPQDSGLI